MSVSAQVSLYPLRQQYLQPSIDAFRAALERAGLAPEVGPMSTVVIGGAEALFFALRAGFEEAAAIGPVTMVVTVSNACPVADSPRE